MNGFIRLWGDIIMLGAKLIEAVGLIGKKAVLYTKDGFATKVNVLDIKVAWGKIRYLVKDEFGNGELWVSEDRIEALSHVKTALNIIKEVLLP
jgi:hypothetical protein